MAKTQDENIQAQLKKIGDRLTQLRKEAGYSNYEQFAYEHSISRSQVSRYENGEDMRVSSLLKMLKALDISLEDFFKEGFNNQFDKENKNTN